MVLPFETPSPLTEYFTFSVFFFTIYSHALAYWKLNFSSAFSPYPQIDNIFRVVAFLSSMLTKRHLPLEVKNRNICGRNLRSWHAQVNLHSTNRNNINDIELKVNFSIDGEKILRKSYHIATSPECILNFASTFNFPGIRPKKFPPLISFGERISKWMVWEKIQTEAEIQ